jgi:LacI family transcriptional regulator
MKMTSEELAKLCNVSRATVDRVFNSRGRVNKTTKQKILDMAESVGYRPNYIAQALVKGRTMSIGLVVPGLNNYFFSTLLNAITARAQQSGYITLVALYEGGPVFETKCVRNLLERQVDGIILFSTKKSCESGESVSILREQSVPIVAILNEVDGLPCVSIDYHRAMYDAANYIISKEYKHLIFLCPPLAYEIDSNIYAIRQRLDGFEQAMELHRSEGIAGTIIGTADYMETIDAMSFSRDVKTAILCSSDIYALKILKLLKSKGIHVPLDVGVMGFDDIDVLDYVEPSIATVSIPIARLGEAAVDCLLGQIMNGIVAQGARLPYKIKPGQSIV